MRVLALLVVLALSSLSSAARANPFVINEIVNNPTQDWNDGTPFDPSPGSGSVTEDDEYVELHNVAVTPQSLEGYYLEMLDSTAAYDCFSFNAITPPGTCENADVYLVFDSAGSFVGSTQNNLRNVPAGGYVLIGNPPGAMNTDIQLTLVDETGGMTVDVVARDVGTTWNGDESLSRFPDGADTGDDDVDIAPTFASPGSSNGAPCSLAVGDVVVNEIVSDPQQDWDHDAGGTPFDGTPGAGGVSAADDEYVELANTSGGVLDLRRCVLELADSGVDKLVFSTTDAPLAPFVRVFDDTGTQVGTASAIDSIPAGGYVLVGDPPDSMNQTVTVSVLSDAGAIDTATVSAGAASLLDESASRFPDATDTDVDADDFSPVAATPGASNGTKCALAAGSAVINEAVTDPQQDWDHDVSGTPFDGTAGAGNVSNTDEYVEIKNTSGAALDVTGCVLLMTDTTAEKLVLQPIDAPAAPYVRVFDDAGAFVGNAASLTAVPIDGYVLVGDPPGAMNNDAIVALDSDAGILDTTTLDANADGLLDESASRFPDGADSDVDADDFAALIASPGMSNRTPCPLGVGDAVINEVIGDPQQNWDHDGAATAFDGTAMAGTVSSDDELVELKNTSGAVASFEGCTLTMTDSSSAELVLQRLDAVADPWVRVFDATGTMVGTATALDAVPIDGYVLVGNPPGTLNNSVVVSLSADVELDSLDFGNDAPDLNATDNNDEAASRLPDGADTDVGADDVKLQRATPGASNEIDECTLGLDDCHSLATCVDTPPGFDCNCPPGYIGTGQQCTDANECQAGSHDCDDNALCNNTEGSFTCTCIDGFTGDGQTCTDVDECAGGDDDCDPNATCVNTPGSFECACNDGFEGDGTTCDDINECANDTHDCDENAFCTNTPGSFDCACNTGFEGDGRTCSPASSNDDPADDPEDDGGCSCEVGPHSSRPGAWSLLLALALLARRRRHPTES